MHDLHVWGMATSETPLTAHLVVVGPQVDRDALLRTAHEMQEHFHVRHVTLQVESAECPPEGRC